MQEIITSYLIQKKECGLPLLGSYIIRSIPSQTDVANKKILFPTYEITFSEDGGYLADELVLYCSSIKKISVNEAQQALQQWCLHKKLCLDDGEKVVFKSVGYLSREDGKIVFYKDASANNLFDTVHAERIIHKNDEHAILVGDRETTSTVMNDFYNDSTIVEKRFSWRVAALLLFIVSLLLLAFYFYDHTFSENTIGDQSNVPAVNPPDTYKVP